MIFFNNMENEGSSTDQNSSNLFKTPNVPVRQNRKNRNKKNKNRAKKKEAQQVFNKSHITKRNNKINFTMSSWAETYTKAATWQFNHQIAFWKAKAKALEYENRVLHGIIRKNCLASDISARGSSSATSCSSSTNNSEIESESDEEMPYDGSGDPDLEVTEEFINFLAENAKYKEEAKKERDRLKALELSKEEEYSQRMEPPTPKNAEEKRKEMAMLYGKDWEQISALEVSLHCQFISESDKYSPNYWPNIPFNFNYS